MLVIASCSLPLAPFACAVLVCAGCAYDPPAPAASTSVDDPVAEDPVGPLEDVEPASADAAAPLPSDAFPQWLPPVVGVVTSRFGDREDGSMHDAVDIRAAIGTEVAAPADVRINYIGYRTKAGRFIIADVVNEDGSDAGWELTFAHLSHVDVFEGQRVARGEILGLTGISGAVTGPHLHFRIERVVGDVKTPLDPLQFIALVPEAAE